MEKARLKMDIYFDIIKKSFHSLGIYHVNIIFNLFSGFISIFVQISLWKALYQSGYTQSHTLSETITYTVINAGIVRRLFIYASKNISDAIYSGEIEIDLLRPVTIKEMTTMKLIGQNLFGLCTLSLPVTFTAILLYGIEPPKSLVSLFGAILSIVLGQMLFWLFECILGYTAFWLKANWYLAYLEGMIMSIFGGTAIPLWLYPDILKKICSYMPFQYIGYEAIRIYLNGSNFKDMMRIFFIQGIWLLCFIVLESIVFKKAVQKIEVNGG